MNKREEIREGILDWVEGQAERNIRDNDPKWIEEFCQYLHDNGVVMKVEGESVSCGHIGLSMVHGNTNPECPMRRAGYTLTKPLIEE